MTPLKDIFKHYNDLTSKGFNSAGYSLDLAKFAKSSQS